jgi:hypothetical protein
MSHVSIWFIAFKLVLNLDKMNTVILIIHNSVQYSPSVDYDKIIEKGKKVTL